MRTLFAFLAVIALPAWAGLTTDIEFARAGDVRLLLDAYVPDGSGLFAAAIIVHGGGFTHGDKQTFVKPLFEPLEKAGFAWFSINYRMAPQYNVHDADSDIDNAIRWVKQYARKYKVDPKKIALIGESAGGHLVACAGVENKRDARVAAT